ncbi:MAG: hypothetical protein MJ188_02220 [Treponema sp.]|nr:hypothetical protein [Treponema sp.]
MEKYSFTLSPAYSTYKIVAVLQQDGASIRFVMQKRKDTRTKTKLRKAFLDYLDYVKKQEDCPENFKHQPEVEFVYVSREQIKYYLAKSKQNAKKRKAYIGS